ncbi:MAG: indole-3-glycerol phosphate synthase TrpC [Geminicoccaceae bacterium]|nr:indole-3-glycerol phosphate synthase TrpC [Geminicoccaceae bacterium]
MSDVLERICATKREHVARRKAETTLSQLEARIRDIEPPRGFRQALCAKVAAGRPALIAEIKKASPSKGLIRPDFDPPALALAYREGGASCLSVLTDEPYFQGHDLYLGAAREASGLPALRKDFMLDPWQIAEARSIGADCVLLIMACLEDGIAAELAAAARHYGMDVLVEVHDAGELERALRLDIDMVGINNRNLKTLSIDLATTEKLAPSVPSSHLVVAESGLYSNVDLRRMQKAGAGCFLVGESLMRQDDVALATKKLLGTA